MNVRARPCIWLALAACACGSSRPQLQPADLQNPIEAGAVPLVEAAAKDSAMDAQDEGKRWDAPGESSLPSQVDASRDAWEETAPPYFVICRSDGTFQQASPPEQTPPSFASTLRCPSGARFGDGVRLAVPQAPTTHLLSVTPDRHWWAFAQERGSASQFIVSERTESGEFLPAAAVGAPADYAAVGGASLSADGLRLVVVKPDRKSFTEYTRADEASVFDGAPDDSAFLELNRFGSYFPYNEFFGYPVVSADDTTILYSRDGGTTIDTVYQSRKDMDSGVWAIGEPVGGRVLQTLCGKRRVPTGLSSDLLTLFYDDEVSASARMTFRAGPAAPFEGWVDLGPKSRVIPSNSCSTIAYDGSEDGGVAVLETTGTSSSSAP